MTQKQWGVARNKDFFSNTYVVELHLPSGCQQHQHCSKLSISQLFTEDQITLSTVHTQALVGLDRVSHNLIVPSHEQEAISPSSVADQCTSSTEPVGKPWRFTMTATIEGTCRNVHWELVDRQPKCHLRAYDRYECFETGHRKRNLPGCGICASKYLYARISAPTCFIFDHPNAYPSFFVLNENNGFS